MVMFPLVLEVGGPRGGAVPCVFAVALKWRGFSFGWSRSRASWFSVFERLDGRSLQYWHVFACTNKNYLSTLLASLPSKGAGGGGAGFGGWLLPRPVGPPPSRRAPRRWEADPEGGAQRVRRRRRDGPRRGRGAGRVVPCPGGLEGGGHTARRRGRARGGGGWKEAVGPGGGGRRAEPSEERTVGAFAPFLMKLNRFFCRCPGRGAAFALGGDALPWPGHGCSLNPVPRCSAREIASVIPGQLAMATSAIIRLVWF